MTESATAREDGHGGPMNGVDRPRAGAQRAGKNFRGFLSFDLLYPS